MRIIKTVLYFSLLFFPFPSFSAAQQNVQRSIAISQGLDAVEKEKAFDSRKQALRKIQKYKTPQELLHKATRYLDNYKYEKKIEKRALERSRQKNYTEKKYRYKKESGEFKGPIELMHQYLAETMHLTFGLKGGYIKGDTTYRINDGTFISELKWPLDTWLLGLTGGIFFHDKELKNRTRTSIVASWLKDVAHSGKMEDSDWIFDDGHSGLDIFSESSTEIDLTMWDIQGIYNFLLTDTFSLGAVVGHRWQKFGYEGFDTDQVGFGPWVGQTIFIPGHTILYMVRYRYLYFGVTGDAALSDTWFVRLTIGYSPWVRAKDRDDHILRPKLSEGETHGDALFFIVSTSLEVVPDFLIDAGFEYTDIETSGTQHQLFYAGPLEGTTFNVHDDITLSYWQLFLAFSFII